MISQMGLIKQEEKPQMGFDQTKNWGNGFDQKLKKKKTKMAPCEVGKVIKVGDGGWDRQGLGLKTGSMNCSLGFGNFRGIEIVYEL